MEDQVLVLTMQDAKGKNIILNVKDPKDSSSITSEMLKAVVDSYKKVYAGPFAIVKLLDAKIVTTTTDSMA